MDKDSFYCIEQSILVMIFAIYTVADANELPFLYSLNGYGLRLKNKNPWPHTI